MELDIAGLALQERYKLLTARPVGRPFGTRYCTTRQRFDLPGPLPAE